MIQSVYTAFVFREEERLKEIKNLHCTHKYFGEVTQATFDKIMNLCDLYFDWKAPGDRGLWTFDHIDTFDMNAVVVRRLKKSDMLLDLREAFDGIKKDDYPEYNPHITLVRDGKKLKNPIELPIDLAPIGFALYRGGKNSQAGFWTFEGNK